MAAKFPAINGFHPSWASIEISVGGEVTPLIKSIEYGNSKTRGMGRGQSGRKKLRTRGTEEPSASLTFYSMGFRDFRRKLAEAGRAQDPPVEWQDQEFDATISYENPDGDIETDQLERCLVNDWTKSASDDSEDPTEVECELDIMRAVLDGDVAGADLP